jgi:hypothetical protein
MALMVQVTPGALEAVKSPPVVILPQVADQVTGMLAVNCCV